jgi:hypothetical protein
MHVAFFNGRPLPYLSTHLKYFNPPQARRGIETNWDEHIQHDSLCFQPASS